MTTYPANFCPYCGADLTGREIEGRERQFCPDCERVVWRNPVPTAGVAVVGAEGVLLTERAVEPGIGEWTVSGGHLELAESPREGAARELREETGVRVAPEDLTLLDTFSAAPFEGKRVVSVGFGVRRADTAGDPHPGPEVSAVEWFTPESFGDGGEVFHPPHGQRFEKAWRQFE
ncbi:NUDIX hydrolase [Halorussus sp. MSC15.2]|uniref:NUDIX hydrolase n=1 Tax=Halorussus sp. MSC15.2 TaxID=2283638 RepID=UPI0013D39BDD|nr:NUDIX domain-containing protein [Halorussus sp. MSC15.2]NEU58524.1 NUDIX domain-containing protein [Halorussus sp. MSC15.2]